jgi:hypothetical protein
MSDGLVFGPAAKPWEETSARLSGILDAALEHKEHTERDRVMSDPQYQRPAMGVGSLGNECLRAIAYQYFRVPVDPDRKPSGKLLRIFKRGHNAESGMADYLRLAGFVLLTERANGGQFRFDAVPYEDGKGRLKGMADGVITAWIMPPEQGSTHHPGVDAACWAQDLPFPLLWENKEVNHKKWNSYQKSGVRKSSPEYFVQMQMLMAYLDLGHALFTAKNADTQEIFAELVPFDARAAQEASDKAVKIIQANAPEELPRIASEASDFRCKFCDYAERCWSAKATTNTGAVVAAPSWLKTS